MVHPTRTTHLSDEPVFIIEKSHLHYFYIVLKINYNG